MHFLPHFDGVSIARFSFRVEVDLLMCTLPDLLYERQLRPAELPDSADVPRSLGKREVGVEYDDVLCPADLHRRTHDIGLVFVGVVKLPHPAHASRGETFFVRLLRLQILRHGDRRALLRALGNQPSYFPI